MDKLSTLLQSGGPILLDGAMGTMLIASGLQPGDCPEEWNVLHPEVVREIHSAYIEAGSQIILTNTFGGSTIRLNSHGKGEQVFEFNQAAARNARAEADASPHPVLVAGSIGPTGQMLAPLGSMSFEDARNAFAEQAAGLAAGGVDLFWIETMSDLEEVRAAYAGVREVSSLPVTATMSFDTRGHTMMGVKPERAVKELAELDLAALGANCGTGSDELIEAIRAMRESAPEAVLIAKANAGIPQVVGDEVVYSGSPEVMAEYARAVYQSGAQLIGGCCGSTPEHIRAMRDSLFPKN